MALDFIHTLEKHVLCNFFFAESRYQTVFMPFYEMSPMDYGTFLRFLVMVVTVFLVAVFKHWWKFCPFKVLSFNNQVMIRTDRDSDDFDCRSQSFLLHLFNNDDFSDVSVKCYKRAPPNPLHNTNTYSWSIKIGWQTPKLKELNNSKGPTATALWPLKQR